MRPSSGVRSDASVVRSTAEYNPRSVAGVGESALECRHLGREFCMLVMEVTSSTKASGRTRKGL